MSSPVDIRPDHLAIVQGILRDYLPVGVKVWVFGSRANWTTKDSSDLDLALESESRLNHKLLAALKDAFEDSTPPPIRLTLWTSIGLETPSGRSWSHRECLCPWRQMEPSSKSL